MSYLMLITDTFRILVNKSELTNTIQLGLGNQSDRTTELIAFAEANYPADVELRSFYGVSVFGNMRLGIVRSLDDPKLLN